MQTKTVFWVMKNCYLLTNYPQKWNMVQGQGRSEKATGGT
jgi:hypothetical protein